MNFRNFIAIVARLFSGRIHPRINEGAFRSIENADISFLFLLFYFTRRVMFSDGRSGTERTAFKLSVCFVDYPKIYSTATINAHEHQFYRSSSRSIVGPRKNINDKAVNAANIIRCSSRYWGASNRRFAASSLIVPIEFLVSSDLVLWPSSAQSYADFTFLLEISFCSVIAKWLDRRD